MVVLLAFLIGVFVVTAWTETRGRTISTGWLIAATVVVATSFYSLRVID